MADAQDEFDAAWDDLTKGTPSGKVDDSGKTSVAVETDDDPLLADDSKQEATGEQEATPAAEATGEQDDPWTGLSESQRKLLENLQAVNTDLTTRLNERDSRVSGLHKQMHRMEQEMQQLRSVAPAAAQAVVSDPDLEAFQKEYPDIAGPVMKLVGNAAAKAAAIAKAEVAPVAKRVQQIDDIEAEHAVRNAMEAVEEKHPGWRQTVATQDFHAWLNKQPPGVKAMGGSMVADDAIYLLDLFTSATSQVADITRRRQQRTEQAVSVQGLNGAAPRGRASIPDDFDAAWDAFDAQDRQRAAGR